MTTPTKSEIIERAFQNNMKRNYDVSTITPTIEELKEDGSYTEAQHDLMRSEETEYLAQLEKIAGSLGYGLTKIKNQYTEDLDVFPISTIMREGCFTTGGRGSGKSNLLKLLVQKLITSKIKVKVFDPSLTWKSFPLPKIKVRQDCEIKTKWNHIIDISRLSVIEARDYVRDTLKEDLNEAVNLTDVGIKHQAIIVIEECQNIIPSHSLRSMKYSEISRFVTQSRNFGMSYVVSTQRLASVDINLIEISGVKYFFKSEGHRNLSKIRWWLNKYETWNLRNLEIGQCYVQYNGKVKLVRLPLFDAQKVIA